MRLVELEPEFLKWTDDHHFQRIDTIQGADGVMFLCPVCFQTNNGPVGTHAVICWAPQVPQTTYPVPGRWQLQGTGYQDLTLVAGSSSVFLNSPGGCGAHFYVRNGEIIMC